MSDGFFEVTFSPDPENHKDFAFKWQGKSGTRGRGNTFATSAAKSAWYTFAAAMGQPQSALPDFISVKHRIIRASNLFHDPGWIINMNHFRRNVAAAPAPNDLPTSKKSEYFAFLMSRINFVMNTNDIKKLDTRWHYMQETGTLEFRLKKEFMEIRSLIDIYSYRGLLTSYDHSTFKNAVNSIVFNEALSSFASEIKCSRSYMFELSSSSATLRAARLNRYKEEGARLAHHFRSQGNKDLAKRMEAWAERPAPKEF